MTVIALQIEITAAGETDEEVAKVIEQAVAALRRGYTNLDGPQYTLRVQRDKIAEHCA